MTMIRASLQQAKGDLRPNLYGYGIISLAMVGLFLFWVFREGTGDDASSGTSGALVLAGLIGGLSSLIIMQVNAEYYSDRIGGVLLRVRTMPNGPTIWTIGKTMSTMVLCIIPQLVIMFLGTIFSANSPFELSRFPLTAAVVLLSAIASCPLGFMLGSFLRGTYTQLVSYVLIGAYVCTSGFFAPLTSMPGWLQVIHQALPAYWAGHLSRWALVGDPSFELNGTFTPLLAFGVLIAWTVIGFGVLPFIIRRSFRKESIGSLATIQEKTRTQMGL